MIKISREDKYLAFAILIGGKSERFGEDKGLFEINERPLIDYQLDTLKEFRYDIFLIAHSKKQVRAYFNLINFKYITGFILDEKKDLLIKDIRAPMIGLYSAFKELINLSYQKIFAISCDMPLIKSQIIDFIIEESYNYDCCMPIWKNSYIEPLFAIYSVKKGLKSSRENIINKKFKLTNLIKKNWTVNYLSVEKKLKKFDDKLLTFVNVNRPEDLKNIGNKLMKK